MFHPNYSELMSKCNIYLRTLLQDDLSESDFYVVDQFRKKKQLFLEPLKDVVIRYMNTG